MTTPEKTQLLNQTMTKLKQLSADKIGLVLAFANSLAKQEAVSDETASISDFAFSEEEALAMITPNPITDRQIVEAGHTGGWEDIEVDGATWVKQQRAKRREIVTAQRRMDDFIK